MTDRETDSAKPSQLIETIPPAFSLSDGVSHHPPLLCASSCLGWEGPITEATHTLQLVWSCPAKSEDREGAMEGGREGASDQG